MALTLESALIVARNIRDIDKPYQPDSPLPSCQEALEIIEDALGRYDFNWITGQDARDLLRKESGYE
jgi:hypothetical protein